MMHYMKKTAVLCIAMFPLFSFAETKKTVEGYGPAKWGANMAEARKSLKGRIVFDDEKRSIVTKDGEILYRYGFVYKETAPAKEAAPAPSLAPVQPSPSASALAGQGSPAPSASVQPSPTPAPQSAEKVAEAETKLFYVITEFPYVAMEDIRKKMIAEYGEPTGDTITKAQGTLIWDSGKGAVIAWIDAYEKKPYCRRISYLSKEIAKELSVELNKAFNKREMDVIKKLNP